MHPEVEQRRCAMITTTTTPDVIYLLMVLFAPSAGNVGYEELYRTTDKAACEAQAKEWSAALAPNKFACVSHAQKKLKPDANRDD